MVGKLKEEGSVESSSFVLLPSIYMIVDYRHLELVTNDCFFGEFLIPQLSSYPYESAHQRSQK
jgi:hypothetical protein